MYVDVRELPPTPSSIVPEKGIYTIAIAATLGFIALLSSLLRVYTHGRVTRSFAIDDVLALAAALCVIGALITFARLVHPWVEVDRWGNSIGIIGPWKFALALTHAFGISIVKLSAAFYLLRVFEQKYCRYLLHGIIAILLTVLLEWFVSTLLRCAPVAAAWNPSLRDKARCMSFSTGISFVLVNNAINTGTDLLLAALILPIAFGSSLRLGDRAFITLIACVSFIACAAAIARTERLFVSKINDEENDTRDATSLLCVIVELSTALVALNLPTFTPLAEPFKSYIQKRRRPLISQPKPCIPPSNNSSYQFRYSSQMVIYRPNTAYTPSLARFHDDESNLDFDIETPATRTRTHTMRTCTTHSRNVSDWSQFSGFTYYTNATEPPALATSQSRLPGVSMTELEEIVKSLGLEKTSHSGMETRLSISARKKRLPHERDRGKEIGILPGSSRIRDNERRNDSSDEEGSIEGGIRRPGYCKTRKM